MRKALFVGVIIVVLVGLLCKAQSNRSALYRAFLDHEKLESPEVKSYYPMVGGEDFVLSERWKNYQKYTAKCPSIGEVTRVSVSKTVDTGNFTVTLYGIDAHEDSKGFDVGVCTIWTTSSDGVGAKVEDVTDY